MNVMLSQRGEAMHNTHPIFLSAAAFLLLIGIPASVLAQPEIARVDGFVNHGDEIQIQGAGFGGKSPARPLFWAPMDGSADPSPLGLLTSWSDIGGMAYAEGEGPAGGGALKATDSGGIWTAQVNATGDFSWASPGQKMYLYRKLKQNFSYLNPDGSEKINWKTWRLWGEILETGNRTSIYTGASNGTFSMDHSVESQQGLWPINVICAQGSVDNWNTNEMLLQSNTNAVGRGDGFFQYKTNGAMCGQVPYQAWEGTRHLKLWDSVTTPRLQRNFIVHGVKANYTMDPGDRYWATSVYLDTTWARVMIANAPTLTAASILEIQIPTEWSENSIKMQTNKRAFPADQPAYLFVVNSENKASAGFPLTLSAPLPPEDVRAN
jgi:hypothetical protein